MRCQGPTVQSTIEALCSPGGQGEVGELLLEPQGGLQLLDVDIPVDKGGEGARPKYWYRS